MEKLNLPEKYNYKIIEIDENRAIFRISDLVNKESAQEWIKEYEQRSETVWRVQRTHKSTGRLNVYKGDFRCQHNVQQHVARDIFISV
ncbi:hypothetical protein HNY73_002449 [Argiope bruennichi]|uniref:Uncharacterized protein n=1 Tax=Argiope bruennichi TaxID=94029 RepID=A0A8T0FXY0_ARGBR|nr:hypothetical protein HNY73_002449 [Argiope bruennichi]